MSSGRFCTSGILFNAVYRFNYKKRPLKYLRDGLNEVSLISLRIVVVLYLLNELSKTHKLAVNSIMEQVIFYLNLGFKHVLDINAYDHVLYFIMLIVPYTFNNWKKILGLVTVFTVGHTTSLLLATYQIIWSNSAVIECLIPITILITGIVNLFLSRKGIKHDLVSVTFFTTLFFGIIHGFGFSSFFRMNIEQTSEKFVPLIGFALGIESSQIIVVFMILLLGFLIQRFSVLCKKDWILVVTSIVIGVVLPILKETCFL